MARVTDIEVDEVPRRLQATYRRYVEEYGPFLNQVRVFAHRPPALEHVMGLLLDLADEQQSVDQSLWLALLAPKNVDPDLVRTAVADLVHELVGDGDRSMMVDEFDDDEYELRLVVDAAQTPPFLTDKRVVVARDVGGGFVAKRSGSW